ncbi:hypothetical protein PSHT_02612 [Puccinia striiformis]|uniref:Autophagy-related protein 14 n=1 Tax=Puccinia striiformis TaxID=27350 RepID=A0A2S4WHK4_9BASI|nr:hypothetical protein PSHT_02612 [Puccinia striiformis]
MSDWKPPITSSSTLHLTGDMRGVNLCSPRGIVPSSTAFESSLAAARQLPTITISQPTSTYSENCYRHVDGVLSERLLIHNSSLTRLSAAHDVTVQKATQLLEAPGGVQERRVLKSKRAALILSIRSLEAERPRTLETSEFLQATITKKRGELAIRQSKLHAARSQLRCRLSALHQPTSESSGRAFCEQSGQPMDLPQQIDSVQQDWDRVTQELAHVRHKLITQLCSIYTITVNYPPQCNPRLEQQTSSSRDQTPSAAFSAPSWRILGLGLPVSTEIKSYHHEEISAATLYTSHLLRLLAMYLGISCRSVDHGTFSELGPSNSFWSQNSITSMVHSSGSQVSQIAFLSGLCMLAINAHYLLLTQQPQHIPLPAEPQDPHLPLPLNAKLPPPSSASRCKPTELLRTSILFVQHSLDWSDIPDATDDPFNPACIDLQDLITEVYNLSLTIPSMKVGVYLRNKN